MAEFAENYNRQAAYIGQSSTWILDETGAWKRAPDPPGTLVVDLDGSWHLDHDFRYTLENEAVRAVTLERAIENTEDWVYFPTGTITTAATALIWAQEDVPLWTFGRKALFRDLANADWENGFTVRKNGAVITWEVESRNFHISGDSGLAIPNDKENNFFFFRCTIALED